MRYSIWDPTGNVTALVESEVPVADQPAQAATLMERHPEVEQVGFVHVDGPDLWPGVDAELRMAGGEFCGNASICTAALYLMRFGKAQEVTGTGERTVFLRVSGAEGAVGLRLRPLSSTEYEAAIRMPKAADPTPVALAYESSSSELQLVRMDGISHLVIEPSSPFWSLMENHAAAEEAVRVWCHKLCVDGLGLMFLGECAEAGVRPQTPLVYVPGADTCFWESSCASGSAAVGIYLAAQVGASLSVDLNEPGGVLRVDRDPEHDITWLQGRTRLLVDSAASDHKLWCTYRSTDST